MLTQSGSAVRQLHRFSISPAPVLIATIGLCGILFHNQALAHDSCMPDCTQCDHYSSTVASASDSSISFCPENSLANTPHERQAQPKSRQQGLTKVQRAALLRLFAAIARHQ